MKNQLTDSANNNFVDNIANLNIINQAIDPAVVQYLPILIFLCLAFGLSVVIIAIPFIINKMNPDSQKNSTYECGFEGSPKIRHKFEVQFYLVAILFIIFDLEIAFLFPWAVSLKNIGLFGFYSMIIFLFLLTIGFIYEWRKGALNWK